MAIGQLTNQYISFREQSGTRNAVLRMEVPKSYWRFDEASAMVATHQAKVQCILEWSGSGLVLDLGCNDGGIANRIRQGGARVIAADRRPYAQTAHLKYGLLAVGLDANEALPFVNGAFDAVVVSGLLEYLTAPEELLAEARRILNPAGRLVLVAPNRESVGRKYNRWKGLPPSAEARFDMADLRRMLSEAGFAIRTYRGCAYRPRNLRGRIFYVLERLLPKFVTDCAFLCEVSQPGPKSCRTA